MQSHRFWPVERKQLKPAPEPSIGPYSNESNPPAKNFYRHPTLPYYYLFEELSGSRYSRGEAQPDEVVRVFSIYTEDLYDKYDRLGFFDMASPLIEIGLVYDSDPYRQRELIERWTSESGADRVIGDWELPELFASWEGRDLRPRWHVDLKGLTRGGLDHYPELTVRRTIGFSGRSGVHVGIAGHSVRDGNAGDHVQLVVECHHNGHEYAFVKDIENDEGGDDGPTLWLDEGLLGVSLSCGIRKMYEGYERFMPDGRSYPE